MTGNKERERGSDTQKRNPGRESNPGTLQSLNTWDARSTHWAERRPNLQYFDDEQATCWFDHDRECFIHNYDALLLDEQFCS